ncbi:MAG TPA: hypothetical protein VMH28_33470 [Candidatus Acidoferrales bacterium]|nr:hypothetical protein [Candidatus Acidoferrales bacterium]
MKLALAPMLFALNLCAQSNPLDFLNHNQPVPDAHNCYPYKGEWKDRIDRALRTPFPVAIEQDIAWARGEPVVSHTSKTTGAEPSLRAHFFERVRPIVEKALAENDRARWPIIVLHFDFKSVQPELLRAVWNLLGEYQDWITTAEKTADPHRLSPFEAGPLLVLTEDADEQEQVFFQQVAVDGRLRVFGSAHTAQVQAETKEKREHLQATLPPDQLLKTPPTNYRRWWNNSWFVVEEGGQHKAGDWTDADDRRLRALVDHAHTMGYWIRFFTLDGFAPGEDKGWGDSYNFGSRQAVMARWKAAMAAGVNLIASDQYEDLAAAIR